MGTIKRYQTRLYYARRDTSMGISPYSGMTIAAINTLRDARHYSQQNYNDYARRGQSNREGANNKSYRKYLSSRVARIESSNFVILGA